MKTIEGHLGALRAKQLDVYHEAKQADEEFHRNLVRQFGSSAGDRRYDVNQRGWDEETKVALHRFLLASSKIGARVVKPSKAKGTSPDAE